MADGVTGARFAPRPTRCMRPPSASLAGCGGAAPSRRASSASSTATRSSCGSTAARARALHRRRHAGVGQAGTRVQCFGKAAAAEPAAGRGREVGCLRRRGARPLRAPAGLRLPRRPVRQRRADPAGYGKPLEIEPNVAHAASCAGWRPAGARRGYGAAVRFLCPMRMRQSIAEIEDAFFEEIEEDRERRERLRRRAERRQLERHRERTPPARVDALLPARARAAGHRGRRDDRDVPDAVYLLG